MTCGSAFDSSGSITADLVFVEGYHQIADQGGGTFVNLGTLPTSTCGPNGGSRIQDNPTAPAAKHCFQRINSTYGPKEFGAVVGDTVANATLNNTALKNWLNANQPHIGDFGTYSISTGLSCNGATIHGPNDMQDGNYFTIKASDNFIDTTPSAPSLAVFHAGIGCGLFGVAINANSKANGLSAEGDKVTMAESSAISNGPQATWSVRIAPAACS